MPTQCASYYNYLIYEFQYHSNLNALVSDAATKHFQANYKIKVYFFKVLKVKNEVLRAHFVVYLYGGGWMGKRVLHGSFRHYLQALVPLIGMECPLA